jgi:hypothetical protein
MLRVQMAFACEEVARESSGPVTFKNIMDGIMAPDFPAPTGRWFAIFSFFSEEARRIGNCRVVVEYEKGELVAQNPVRDLEFTPQNPISRTVVSFQGMTWPYPGRYLVKFVAERDDVLAYFPMWVQHAPAAVEEGSQA